MADHTVRSTALKFSGQRVYWPFRRKERRGRDGREPVTGYIINGARNKHPPDDGTDVVQCPPAYTETNTSRPDNSRTTTGPVVLATSPSRQRIRFSRWNNNNKRKYLSADHHRSRYKLAVRVVLNPIVLGDDVQAVQQLSFVFVYSLHLRQSKRQSSVDEQRVPEPD